MFYTAEFRSQKRQLRLLVLECVLLLECVLYSRVEVSEEAAPDSVQVNPLRVLPFPCSLCGNVCVCVCVCVCVSVSVSVCVCLCVCVQEGCPDVGQSFYFAVPFMIYINREGALIRADVYFAPVKSQERMQASN